MGIRRQSLAKSVVTAVISDRGAVNPVDVWVERCRTTSLQLLSVLGRQAGLDLLIQSILVEGC
jgi:hypothetical protein